jgi:pyruvate dehydrogenase E2 component (dihydrolipoamide acetyltransferase)
MATPVIMPKLEMTQETATVVEWLKREGEPVEKGEPLLTVETDKVTVEVEAPATGILGDVRAGPGDVVPVTQVIAQVLSAEEAAASSRAAETPSNGPPPAPARATPVAQRLAAAAGMDVAAMPGSGARGRVTKADVLAAAAGDTGRVRATPAARRLARERGLALEGMAGSGPRGRVQAADVPAQAPNPPATGGRAPVEAQIVPLAGMRRTIAERMTLSHQTVPHITLTVRVDMSGFEAARARLNTKAQAGGGPHVSVTALVVKAVAWALRRHPILNGTLRGEEIHLLPEVNVGVAVALEEGLIVPVVHAADRKSLAEVAAAVNDLSARARQGRLTPADVAGGTFTVSNLGPFGVEQFTAIINPLQAGILALGAMQPEGVVVDGRLEVRPVLRLTLSADHRIVDGAVAARFLADLRAALEEPLLLL